MDISGKFIATPQFSEDTVSSMEAFPDFINNREDLRKKYYTDDIVAGSKSKGLGEIVCLSCIDGAQAGSNCDIRVGEHCYEVKSISSKDKVFMGGTRLLPIVRSLRSCFDGIHALFDDEESTKTIDALLESRDFPISQYWLTAAQKVVDGEKTIDFTNLPATQIQSLFGFADRFTKLIKSKELDRQSDIACGLVFHSWMYEKLLKSMSVEMSDSSSKKLSAFEKVVKKQFFSELKGLLVVIVNEDLQDYGHYKLFKFSEFCRDFILNSFTQNVRPRFKYTRKGKI